MILVAHGLFYQQLIKSLAGAAHTNTIFLTANAGYWIVEMKSEASSAKESIFSRGTQLPRQRTVAFLASNEVGHIPMEVRTGHSSGGFRYCTKTYLSESEMLAASKARRSVCVPAEACILM